jgi:hypothetical protein
MNYSFVKYCKNSKNFTYTDTNTTGLCLVLPYVQILYYTEMILFQIDISGTSCNQLVFVTWNDELCAIFF